jgi:hypothetical protein
MKKLKFLDSNIFQGLTNLNDGFDVESIKYFSEIDFEIVLNRVEKLGLGINGIEPWLNGEFYDVLTYEDFKSVPTDPKWYNQAFKKFRDENLNLLYAATYEIPNHLINEARLYVDLNEMIDSNLVLLSQTDNKEDSDGKIVKLKEGLKVKIYMDAIDEFGEPDNLIGEGVVELNTFGEKYSWTSAAKWNCRINDKGMYHESEEK